MSTVETAHRFLRPADIGRVRRNQRRIQLTRAVVVGRNILFVAIAVALGLWIYRRTQSDARFAVRHIEIAGTVHTPRPVIESIARNYVGLNLFKIDIGRVQRDLGTVAWIRRISIEKKLPDTLRIKVVERTPAALLNNGGALTYVDGSGVVVAELSPSVGDSDLPVITNAMGSELQRTIAALDDLRQRDPMLYARIGEIRPLSPRGFAIFDRDLGATVYANADDLAQKWRELYAIAAAEKLGRASFAYADLRFADRIVLKPLNNVVAAATLPQPTTTAQITN